MNILNSFNYRYISSLAGSGFYLVHLARSLARFRRFGSTLVLHSRRVSTSNFAASFFGFLIFSRGHESPLLVLHDFQRLLIFCAASEPYASPALPRGTCRMRNTGHCDPIQSFNSHSKFAPASRVPVSNVAGSGGSGGSGSSGSGKWLASSLRLELVL